MEHHSQRKRAITLYPGEEDTSQEEGQDVHVGVDMYLRQARVEVKEVEEGSPRYATEPTTLRDMMSRSTSQRVTLYQPQGGRGSRGETE